MSNNYVFTCKNKIKFLVSEVDCPVTITINDHYSGSFFGLLFNFEKLKLWNMFIWCKLVSFSGTSAGLALFRRLPWCVLHFW